MSPDEYLALITSWQRGHPRFSATVAATVAPFADAYNESLALFAKFDLDDAQGPQLDTVGQYVGRLRDVRIPLAGLYFTWGSASLGWGRGVWKGPYDRPSGITRLDDETYRRLIRAKILANSWDGTVGGAQAAFDAFFDDPETFVFVQDNAEIALPQMFFTWGDPMRGWGQGRWKQAGGAVANIPAVDMSMTIAVSGKIPPLVLLAILGQDLIPVKPVGIKVNTFVTSVDQTPLFGFGISNQYIGGWGQGSWGVSPDYLLTQ